MQRIIILSIFISIALAQPCSVWNNLPSYCINSGCAYCDNSCEYTPSSVFEHCHYGDTLAQPVVLEPGVEFTSNPNVKGDAGGYYGYDNFVFNVNEPARGVIITIVPEVPYSVQPFVSQTVAQPDPDNGWTFVNTTTIMPNTPDHPLVGGHLYLGISNKAAWGYKLTVVHAN